MSRPQTMARPEKVTLVLEHPNPAPVIRAVLGEHLDALEAENRRLVEENHEYRRQIVSMRGF